MVLPLLLLSFLGVSHERSRPQSPPELRAAICPAESPTTREIVNRFLTRAGLGAARQETGTTSVTASQVSLLTDATSAAVCARLNAMFGGGGAAGEYRWAYYKAGTRYFVSIEHVDPPNTRRIGFVPFFVLDADLNQLGGFTM